MSLLLYGSVLTWVCCFASAGKPATLNTANTANTAGAGTRPQLTRAQQLLAAYYDGTLSHPQPAAADTVVTAAVGAQQFDWAKPEWGQYRQRAVVHADPAGGGNLTIWAWDIVTEVGVCGFGCSQEPSALLISCSQPTLVPVPPALVKAKSDTYCL